MVELYEHNKTAYESAVSMLMETGRAAIIHPTGTGKSFIGFRLCEDFPDKTVCWLSPSGYIFRMQLENLKVAGGVRLQNICFYTYAKLMSMNLEELEEIRPDVIILDEFHRAGALCWGAALHRFLDIYQNVPVLGLSATNIRYLDGQRDMVDELFNGNVASELTLGEAIVRGILTPPKYVLSTYFCQKELEQYQDRVRKAKSRAVRAEAEKHLDALRRALEKADGLDDIFWKHMTSRTGKYLVFCVDYEHMQEMIGKVPEWFGKVDMEPHVYSVYSEDVRAEEEFERFKADESEHLKLLFCIDMLNEGVHVDGVSGVILLRPTVSPIIYKQQIGRALSTGKKNSNVIFDIVMNIENLYSIGTVEEEMQTAVRYYRDRGEGNLIVNEHFRVIDEVQDCMRLFKKLNETLGASWNLMYQAAKQYFENHGDLEVTKRYVTEDGLSLGQWLDTQRKVHAGKVNGILTESQIALLDKLGMRWESKCDQTWKRNIAVAQAYYKEHGDLLVNIRNGRYQGVELGKWLAQLRTYRKSGIRGNYLTPERIKELETIGMVWDVPDYLWEQNYHAAFQYHKEHGNLDVPYYYVNPEGIKLGIWIANIRFARRSKESGRAKLTEGQIARLDELGMIWDNKNNAMWEKSYAAAWRYWKKFGNLNMPVSYVTEDGCHLGRWLSVQKNSYNKGMSKERRKKLEAIGIS